MRNPPATARPTSSRSNTKASWSRLKTQAAVIDPNVEKLAALLQQSNMTDEQIAAKVSQARSHKMAPETVQNIRELHTRRPQGYTLHWVGWAIGFTLEWRKL